MNSNNSGEARISKRATLFACATLIPFILVSVFTAISSSNQIQDTNGSINFSCHSFANNRIFNMSVDIDLTKGMDQTAAARVATEIFTRGFDMGEGYAVRDFQASMHVEKGIWTIRLDVIYYGGMIGPSKLNYEGGVITRTPTQRVGHELFLIVINPDARTADLYLLLSPTD